MCNITNCTFSGCSTSPDAAHALPTWVMERRQQNLIPPGGRAREQGRGTSFPLVLQESKGCEWNKPMCTSLQCLTVSQNIQAELKRVRAEFPPCLCLCCPYLTAGLEVNNSRCWMNEEINERSKLRLPTWTSCGGPERHRRCPPTSYSLAFPLISH